MDRIINRIVGKIAGKSKKFFPVVNERGIAEKPKKFFPVSECEYLLIQRKKGYYGNGTCVEDF